MSVTTGEPIADFSLPATSEQRVTLNELVGKRVVIYFYPKDNTSGCTTEGQEFSALYREFEQHNCLIFGVSRESIRSHENFKAKYEFPFELISDPDETLCQLFDVIKEKQNYGKTYMGIERSTFLIDENGVLRQQWRKVKAAGHAAEVLQAVKALDS
ncbi:peroxiredoxin [Ectothiorhodospiraceae bacterium BW-2]|nr:peroxiredoxin [Ectothiorhodospiraceae bacterium BW-2]